LYSILDVSTGHILGAVFPESTIKDKMDSIACLIILWTPPPPNSLHFLQQINTKDDGQHNPRPALGLEVLGYRATVEAAFVTLEGAPLRAN
jgi:hypothetical protein